MGSEPKVSSVLLMLNELSDSPFSSGDLMKQFVQTVSQGVGKNEGTGASSSRRYCHGFSCWAGWCVVVGFQRGSLVWGCVVLCHDRVPATGRHGRVTDGQRHLQLHTDASAAGNQWGNPGHRYESAAADPRSSSGDQDYYTDGHS